MNLKQSIAYLRKSGFRVGRQRAQHTIRIHPAKEVRERDESISAGFWGTPLESDLVIAFALFQRACADLDQVGLAMGTGVMARTITARMTQVAQ